jgi:putative membrane protein
MRRTTIAAVALVAVTSLTLVATAAARRTDLARRATTTAQELDDATIVAIFDAANTADIETGELAMKRGQSKEVRDFGGMLAHDHKVVRQQGRDLAAKLGVTPTPPKPDAGAKAHAAAMARLRAVPAAEFDHAFLQHEVAFHKSVIDAVNTTLLPELDNAEVKDLVKKIAPAFQAHMMAAESLDHRLTGTKK